MYHDAGAYLPTNVLHFIQKSLGFDWHEGKDTAGENEKHPRFFIIRQENSGVYAEDRR
jgi:hypothetical protein